MAGVAFGLSAATLAAIGSTAIAAGTTTASFIQAGKQKKAQRKAEREAAKKMASARRSLEKNYMESLSIPLEAYEREMEAINVGTAQATQAAVEGSQRGVAATAGQVQQVASEAQAQQRTKMAEDLFNLEAATAEEASRLRDIGVNLDLAEAEGAQMAAADAARARAQAIQSGIEGVGQTAQSALSLVPLYQKQNVGARRDALEKTTLRGDAQLDPFGMQVAQDSEAAARVQAAFTGSGFDTSNMTNRQFRQFERSMTPAQRAALFDAGYYNRLVPGGMDSFYNITGQ
jgi:hypothetical protein